MILLLLIIMIIIKHFCEHIIQKCKPQRTAANLSQCGCNNKLNYKLSKQIKQIISNKPWTTSNEFQGKLKGRGTSECALIVGKHWSQSQVIRLPTG